MPAKIPAVRQKSDRGQFDIATVVGTVKDTSGRTPAPSRNVRHKPATPHQVLVIKQPSRRAKRIFGTTLHKRFDDGIDFFALSSAGVMVQRMW